jgi:hypothetical protein
VNVKFYLSKSTAFLKPGTSARISMIWLLSTLESPLRKIFVDIVFLFIKKTTRIFQTGTTGIVYKKGFNNEHNLVPIRLDYTIIVLDYF